MSTYRTEELLVKLPPGTCEHLTQDGTPERHSKHSPIWCESESEPHPNNEALSRLEKESAHIWARLSQRDGSWRLLLA